jgi:hypothetical protein
MRRIVSPLLTLSMFLAVALVCAPPALAHKCTASCGGGESLCGSMGRIVFKGCKRDCKVTFAADQTARRACLDTCRGDLATARADCDADRTACNALCAAAVDQTCADETCSTVYRQCRAAVESATRTCVKAAGKDGVAIQACAEPGDAMAGYGRAAAAACVSVDLTGCLAGC